VFVHENDDIFQIHREHVRLITSRPRIEQNRAPIGHDARRDFVVLSTEPIEKADEKWRLRTLVAAAENRDAASACLQSARKFFNDWSFSRPADGEISDADHEAAKLMRAKNSFSIKPQ